jgi:two-component sensor histidine kinase
MIVHELINNAARHAFSRGSGEIRVELMSDGSLVECRVQDNGSSVATVQPGRGLRIINELTKGLDGRFAQTFGSQGSTSVVAFPHMRACTALSDADEPTWRTSPSRAPGVHTR